MPDPKNVKPKNGSPFTAAVMPLPDGTYRRYREYGDKPGSRLGRIIENWQIDCMAVKANMLLAAYEG